MSKKKQLILIVSDLMNNNKKKGRNESSLVRMSENTRKFMHFEKDKVELYPSDTDTSKRLKGSILLDIYKAYSSDLKKLKEKNLSEEEINRSGFVTTSTFKKITDENTNDNKNVWISKDINDSVIGTDPEFIFKNDSDIIIHADSLLQYEGSFGSDGPMGEIRPKPSITTKNFVKSIKDIFEEATKINCIKHLQWLAGCFYKSPHRGYPIGGHIHIGTPIQLIKSLNTNELTWFFFCLNKILDELLGVPLSKLDGVTNSKNRRITFGYFGELRHDNQRLEYRSLSGTWLTHPELTEAVIGTVKAIVNETYNHMMNNKINSAYVMKQNVNNYYNIYNNDFDSWSDIGLTKDMGCICSTSNLRTKIDKPCTDDMTIDNIKKWYLRMKKLSTYDEYAKNIDTLYNILLIPLSIFNKFDKNLQHNWLENASFSPIKK